MCPQKIAGHGEDKKKEETGGREAGEKKKKEGQKRAGEGAVSAQESGPVYVTEKHNVWESSNNAQRLSHNAPGATRGSESSTSSGIMSDHGHIPLPRSSVMFSVHSLTHLRLLLPFSLVFLSRRSRKDSWGEGITTDG